MILLYIFKLLVFTITIITSTSAVKKFIERSKSNPSPANCPDFPENYSSLKIGKYILLSTLLSILF
jgi:hypothetical protein